MVWTIIVFLLVLADQVTKILVRINISGSDSIKIIENFFYLIHKTNTGAAWSFLADKNWGIYVLSAISLITSIFLLYVILKIKSTKLKIAITLICSGSIGNLIDRVLYGGVTDFLDFHFGNYMFPTFNLADSLIVSGSILFAIIILSDNKVLDDFPVLNKIDE